MNKKEILITGGTGSLGKTLVKMIQKQFDPKGIRIFSRTESTQAEFKKELIDCGLNDNVSFLIGDVRDSRRMELATKGVDAIIHCAALKRVDTAEENPLEFIKTNIDGAKNVIYAAINNNVNRVLNVSTDKAVYPTTLYGATKKCAEDLFINANTYTPHTFQSSFACVRYGNVFGSKGSVVNLFQKQAETGELTITDPRMTRFWITLDKVAGFICERLINMFPGDVYIPKMPSMSIVDLAKTIAPQSTFKYIGIRGNEKLHESLITQEETRRTVHNEKYFTIVQNVLEEYCQTKELKSDTNPYQLTREEVRQWLKEVSIK